MKDEIQLISQKPVGREKTKNDFDDSEEPLYQQKPNKRQVKEIYGALDLLNVEVETLKEMTVKGMQSHNNELWRKIDAYFTNYRRQLKSEQLQK